MKRPSFAARIIITVYLWLLAVTLISRSKGWYEDWRIYGSIDYQEILSVILVLSITAVFALVLVSLWNNRHDNTH